MKKDKDFRDFITGKIEVDELFERRKKENKENGNK